MAKQKSKIYIKKEDIEKEIKMYIDEGNSAITIRNYKDFVKRIIQKVNKDLTKA